MRAAARLAAMVPAALLQSAWWLQGKSFNQSRRKRLTHESSTVQLTFTSTTLVAKRPKTT